jgi:U6 snRNA phosphodiesterase
LQLNELELYCNDEKTRTFIGIKVFEEDAKFLETLVKKYDNCLDSYNLQKYYQPPSFHISILWCLGDKREALRIGLNHLNQILQKYLDDDIQEFSENVKNIYFKCGNRIYNYELQ